MGQTKQTPNIIWLASYPKSGNTWIRIFFANYLNQDNKAIDINNINTSIISSSRTIFDNYLPFLSSDLTFEEIDILRPKVYREISEETEDIQFIKTHDAFTLNSEGKAIFPREITKAVIHIVRNPLDVAVSFAHHSHISIDKSIKTLNSDQKSLANNPQLLNKQLRQILLSWSEHYLSWKGTKTPYLLIKYEDLLNNTEETFKNLVLFLYGEVDTTQLKRAIKYSSFKELKEQEKKNHFKEKPLKADSFFRKGKSNSWKEEMSDIQATKITKKHSKVMKELGYL